MRGVKGTGPNGVKRKAKGARRGRKARMPLDTAELLKNFSTNGAHGGQIGLLIVAKASTVAEMKRKLDMIEEFSTKLDPQDHRQMAITGSVGQ